MCKSDVLCTCITVFFADEKIWLFFSVAFTEGCDMLVPATVRYLALCNHE